MQEGFALRPARNADVEAIVALEVGAFGLSDEPGVRAHLDDAATLADWVVVEEQASGRIVSTCGLLAHRMVLDGVAFPGGQVEYVATHPDFQRRGLVRAQFDWHHWRSSARGDLAQFITGIPYLYRRFGYGYGLDHPLIRIPPASIAAPAGRSSSGVTVRPATEADRTAIVAIDAERGSEGLRVERDGTAWDVLFAMSQDNAYEHLQVAERDGQVVGWMRTQHKPDDGRAYLLPSLVRADQPPTTTLAMVAAARRDAGDDVLVVFDSPATTYSRHLAELTELGGTLRHDHGIYTRVPDPVALLDRLRPALSARLSGSGQAERTGELMISLYGSGVAMAYERGTVTDVRPVAGIEDPYAHSDVGVAPDLFGALVFGRFGAVGLEQRADDVTLGRHRKLMEVLFPQFESDVVGDF
jgi:ribosomal protein S18 acetylase RimI-like enzyme